MKVLIIYEVIPEETILAIVDMTPDEYEFFSQSHGYFINASEYDADLWEVSNILSNALCEHPHYKQYCTSDKQREYFMKYHELRLTEEETDLTSVEKLIRTGIYS